jgi:hypothetical protein
MDLVFSLANVLAFLFSKAWQWLEVYIVETMTFIDISYYNFSISILAISQFSILLYRVFKANWLSIYVTTLILGSGFISKSLLSRLSTIYKLALNFLVSFLI